MQIGEANWRFFLGLDGEASTGGGAGFIPLRSNHGIGLLFGFVRNSASILESAEEQPQILRLTTPELKDVRGPVRSE